MSLQIPVRLQVQQNGAVVGYFETLNFVSGASIQRTGPVANISVSGGGGGGDADTLQGHPASYFATAAQLLIDEADIDALWAALLPFVTRATVLDQLGISAQSSAPVDGITRANWLAGAIGHWAWIQIP